MSEASSSTKRSAGGDQQRRNMTDLEQQILDIIQDGFPIAERPYAVLADLLNRTPTCHPEDTQNLHSEQSVFEAVESLRASGVIRRLGGVYDSRKLGFVSRLCAGVVPASELDFSEPREGRTPTALEKFAEVVAKIPAITHNYVRSHRYNVWFTVIAESEEAVQAVVDKVKSETALQDVHVLASKRLFKINTVMGLDERRETKDERLSSSSMPDAQEKSRFGVEHHPQQFSILQPSSFTLHSPSNLEARRATSYLTTESDKLRVRLLSGDIPHTLTPFTDWCNQCGYGLDEFLEGAREDLATRRMRRFGAVLRHQEAGFAHNAMVCFCIDERREGGNVVAEVGAVLAADSHVSHCYERAPFEGFPYNVYAMFHAESAEELERFIADAAQSISTISQKVKYAVLLSLRELKKTSYTFFG